MKNIKVVIGANFGDEGKGLLVDKFAKESSKGIVIRFNGGSQAGHTVVTPEGTRHVFGHFGSGTLVGLPTYLSSYFIVNPMNFKKEYNDLERKKITPKIYINPNCLVTTPYDMMINQIVEESRGNARHGSCGVGINETLLRNSVIELNVVHSAYDEIFYRLELIRKEYVFQRLEMLGVKDIPLKYVEWLNNTNILENYVRDVEFMLNHTELEATENIFRDWNDLIFEGAQGLLLDRDNKEYFPNLTPSNTGMKNVVQLLKSQHLEDEEIEIVYTTRCYTTRHGVGKFLTEKKEKPYNKIVDITNFPNPYQGTLRFGLLDIDLLRETIKKDLEYVKGMKYIMNVALTCLDQIDEPEDSVYFKGEGKEFRSSLNTFTDIIFAETGAAKIYGGWGLTRNTMKDILRAF